MEDGQILYSKNEQCYFLRLTGTLRFTLGHDFDTMLNIIFKDPGVKDIMIDMSEAEYLDSTILGILAKIANFMIKNLQHKATVLSLNKNINYLLDSIGLDEVFIIVETLAYTPETLKAIPNLNSSEREKALVMLDAHRQLVNINEKNQTVFKDVIELLEKEVE